MQSLQLSLWDAVDSQIGYNALCSLDFTKAENHLTQALKSGTEDKNFVQNALALCRDWQSMVEDGFASLDDSGFLKIFTTYPFKPDFKSFKEALLKNAAEVLIGENRMTDPDTFFDELLKTELWESALDLIKTQLGSNPADSYYHYYLGQCYFRMGRTHDAHQHYSLALWLHPDERFKHRIESPRILTLLENVGIYKAYIAGVLTNQLLRPSSPTDMKGINEEHDRSIQFYRHLQQAENAAMRNDKKSELSARKKMRDADEELFSYYMRLKER